MRLIGLDPGLRSTGWGMIETIGNRLTHLGNGRLQSDGDAPLATRLLQIHTGLCAVLEEWQPDEAAVEETFVNKNPGSTLKLGQARGVVLLALKHPQDLRLVLIPHGLRLSSSIKRWKI